MKGVAVPLAELTLTKGGRETQVALWRETALHAFSEGDWIVEMERGSTPRFFEGDWIVEMHLRGSNHSDYGFKLQTLRSE